MLQDAQKDIRYGIRTLLRNRGFVATALITLDLGIGATTAMFSVVDAVLLRPLPYRDPHRLLRFFEGLSGLGDPRARVAPATYLDLKAQRRLFEEVAALNETAFNLGGASGGARQLNGILTTDNLFSTLGVTPLLGRTFSPEEDRPGANYVALLSYALWQNQFAGVPEIVGQNIRLNGEPYTVIGVMPKGFSFPDKEVNPIDVWAPRAFTSQELSSRSARYLMVIGRVRPGIPLEQVNAELRILADRNIQQYPNDERGVSRYFAEPLRESNTHEVKRGLLMLMIAVTFILLIACANVANLLLFRATARRREIALRTALGAGRSRILRQLLTESSLLSIAGGSLGICLAVASFTLLKYLIPADLFYSTTLHFNLQTFAFAILVCLASNFVFGLAPAMQVSKTDLNEALREGARGSTATRQLLGSAFVAGEIALSLMLLVGAGLLLKSLSNLHQVDPGFQPAHVLTLDFDMAEPRYWNPDVRTHFIERVLEAVRALAGVENAGFTGDLPLTSRGWTEEVTPENTAVWRNAPASPIYQVVTPGYLQAMGIRLIRGRLFDSRDRENALPVAIINQKAAQNFWPNQDPIGKRLKLGGQNSANPWMQVIGVTGNVKHTGLADSFRQEIYCPYLQAKSSLQWQSFLVVRTSGDPLGIVREIRHIAGNLDSDEPLNHVKLLSDIVDAETEQSKTQSTLLGIFAALALIMASVGIYGVMAYLVTQRTQEIGIRMALGAQQRQIVGLVLKRALTLALTGAIIGLFAACILTRLLRNLLFGVSPTDIGILAGVTTLLILTAICACLVPARLSIRLKRYAWNRSPLTITAVSFTTSG